jgi:uncharacterized protein (TIRG00374 family)
MWKRIRKLFQSTAFNIILIFGFAGLVLFFTLKDDGDQVLAALQRVSVPWLLGIFALMIFERWLLGWGLAVEVKLTHPKYTIRQGFINSYVAGLFNNITPGASGGQIAQGYIFKKQGVPVSNSVGVLWLDFIVYQTTMCLFVLGLIIAKFPYFYRNYSQFFLIVIFGFLIAAGIIVFLWLLAVSPRFYTWLTTSGINLGVKLHLVKDKQRTLGHLNEQLEQFAREIEVLRNHKKMILFLGVEDLLRLFIYYSVPYLCAVALGIPVKPSMFLDMLALSSFVAMVNAFLPMPGSSGGTEATFILMFSTLFSKVDASSIMILWRTMTFYQVLIVGTFVFLYARTRKDVPLEEAVIEKPQKEEGTEEVQP